MASFRQFSAFISEYYTVLRYRYQKRVSLWSYGIMSTVWRSGSRKSGCYMIAALKYIVEYALWREITQRPQAQLISSSSTLSNIGLFKATDGSQRELACWNLASGGTCRGGACWVDCWKILLGFGRRSMTNYVVVLVFAPFDDELCGGVGFRTTLKEKEDGANNRSDDEDDDYGVCGSHSEPRHFNPTDVFYGAFNYKEMNNICEPNNDQPAEIESSSVNSSSLTENSEWKNSEGMKELAKETATCVDGVEREGPPSHDVNDTDNAPVDFENSYLLWLPPDPETEEDDRESLLFDEDDDGSEEAPGEWGYMYSSCNLASGEYHNRSTEEHRKAMKNVVDGHFKFLIVQLLQAEHIPPAEEDNKESWSEIVTSLSWEAATLLKPDMSQNGGMDPCGYVKIKCIASGHPRESTVVKGIVCKKNVAHRRMTSKIERPRLLILGGALEYQRVANHLSSFDTLLQQKEKQLVEREKEWKALGFGFLGGGGAHSGRESWGMRKTCKLEDVGHRGKLVSAIPTHTQHTSRRDATPREKALSRRMVTCDCRCSARRDLLTQFKCRCALECAERHLRPQSRRISSAGK
ncbi:hypothetical protein FXO38_18643 [Capsicum annuum]|nr:hypothetical protein FXO38_18643 [Capsicum annuum]